MTTEIEQAETALHAAQSELDARQAELEQAERTHAQLTSELVAAQQAFDSEPSDENADALVLAKDNLERGELFIRRAQARVSEAQGKLNQAEESLKELQIADHEKRLSEESMEQLCAPLAKRYAAALREIADIASELDEQVKESVITDAMAAHRLRTGRDLPRNHVFRTRATVGRIETGLASNFPRCLGRALSTELKAQGFHWRLFRETVHRIADELHPSSHVFDHAEAAE